VADAGADQDSILTLLVRLGESRDERGFSERDGVRLVRWATEVRVGQHVLDMLLADWLTVEVPDEGEPLFSAKGDA
jgi:hypothetical protein